MSKKYVVYSTVNSDIEYIVKNFHFKSGNTTTRLLQQAKVFEGCDKAKTFIMNLPKTMKLIRDWNVSEVAIVKNKLQIVKKIPKKELSKPILSQPADIYSAHYDLKKDNQNGNLGSENVQKDKYMDICSNVANEISLLNGKIASLNYELDLVNKEMNDVEHYIEFNVLSASEGYCAYKMLHDIRVKRRNIKDEITKINNVLELFNSNADYSKIKKNISVVDEQVYTPRVRFELFK